MKRNKKKPTLIENIASVASSFTTVQGGALSQCVNGMSYPPKNSVVTSADAVTHVRVLRDVEHRELHRAVLGVISRRSARLPRSRRTNRLPFDLPEAEGELIAGYHTEYSAMKFSMFYIAEYSNMVTASALVTTLFFGGYDIPFTHWDNAPPWTVVKLLATLAMFSIKVGFFLFLSSGCAGPCRASATIS